MWCQHWNRSDHHIPPPPLNGAHFAHPRKSASARFSPVSWRRNNKWNIRYRRNNNCQYVTNFLQVSTQVEFWPQTTFPLRIWVEDCIEWFENIGDNAKVWISSQVQLYRGTDIQTTIWHQDCNKLFFPSRQDLIMPVGLHHIKIIMSIFFFLTRQDLICASDVHLDLITSWCWHRDLLADVGVTNRGGSGPRVSDIYRRGTDHRGSTGR